MRLFSSSVFQPGFPLRLLLFWLVCFQIARAAFLLLLAFHNPALPLTGWPLVFMQGLRLDFSTACYLCVLPFLLYTVHLIYPRFIIWIRIILGAELFLLIILLLANFQVYKAWGTLINRRAITFLADPAAIVDSLSGMQLLGVLLLFSLLYYVSYKILKAVLLPVIPLTKSPAGKIVLSVCWLLLLPVGIRGGFQQIPINESASTFSEDMRLNTAAMNPVWYFANNLLKSGLHQKNIYKKYPDDEAAAILSSLIKSTISTPDTLITIPRPNIVLIVLESWTADIIAPLGGDTSTTPFFNSLCKEGLLFTNIYSSGRRTDQMFPSILSGFPAQPDYSIIRFPSKTEKLPMLSSDLTSTGYHTSFYYGGELGFANMRNYLLQGKFDRLVSKDDFNEVDNLNKWGAHDQYVLHRHSKDIKQMQQPFFTMLLTLSTHEPFDVPGYTPESGASESEKFRTAASYTDKCLKNYFDEVKKSGIYANTLFILVADHGHLLPRERAFDDPAVYRIPLLLCGGALRPEFTGKKEKTIGSQHDLASTLLHQLHMPASAYRWSNDLLNPERKEFAYLNMDAATGWIENSGSMVLFHTTGKTDPEYTHPPADSTDERSIHLNAYLQVLFEEFLKN